MGMKLQTQIGRFFAYLVLTLGGIAMLTPFFWLISSSLKAPHEIAIPHQCGFLIRRAGKTMPKCFSMCRCFAI